MNDIQKRKVRDNMSYLDHIDKQKEAGAISSEEAEYFKDTFESRGIGATTRYKIWSGLRSSPQEH